MGETKRQPVEEDVDSSSDEEEQILVCEQPCFVQYILSTVKI